VAKLTVEQFRQYLAERPAPKPEKPKRPLGETLRGSKPTTPEQITAYNSARTRLYRERKRNALPEHLRSKQRPRIDLSPEEQRRRLYKAIKNPSMSYTVPPGEYTPYTAKEKQVDDHSATYLRLYNLARVTKTSNHRTAYVAPTNPKRKPRHPWGRLGRPAVERRWAGGTTIRPSILRKNKLLSKSPRLTPTIPRGTLTQTMLHEIMDYVPHLGEFWWISGQRTGSPAGYDRHLTHTREHKGAKYPAHAPKRFTDPYAGLRPQRATSPHPPRSYPGGRIITGRTRELHPIDAQGNAICKPTVRLPIHTDTRGPNGVIHTHHDHHLVRPYNPMRVITVGGVTYPAWQLAILWMGAGYTWTQAYDLTPVSKCNSEPDNNTLLTAYTLDNKPAPPVFRDGNTLNLSWDNIRPDLPPIMPNQEMLIAAQAKYDRKYAKLKQQERTFKALSAENKRKAISDKIRKERIQREKRQLRESTKYNQDKCITKTTFNKVQNKWIVAIPTLKNTQTFFTYEDALAYHTDTINTIRLRAETKKRKK
jgi:hypothetical protein